MDKQTVTRFIVDQKNSESTPNKTIDHTKPSLNLGTLKYSTKKKLTDSENVGTLVFTTDTGEFYVGRGYDSFIKKISDIFVGNKSDFPAVGTVDKLYCAIDEKMLYYWNKTNYYRFAILDVQLYQDVFEVNEEEQNQFHLTKTPLDNIMSMSINGLTYFVPDFTYDKSTNNIIWNKDAENSFSIINSKVVVEYMILKESDNIIIDNDIDNSDNTIVNYASNTVSKKLNKLKISNNKNNFSIAYNGNEVLTSKIQKGVK